MLEGQSHCLVTYVLRKEQCHNNRFTSIFKRTRSLFLGTENYLFICKTAMDLRNLKFLPCAFWFKYQNELWGRNFIQSAYFCDTLSLQNTKKHLILETFLGVLLSRVSAQVEISPLFEQQLSPYALEPCATPPSWLKISKIAIPLRRKETL